MSIDRGTEIWDIRDTESFYTKLFGKPAYYNSKSAIYNIGMTVLIFVQGDHQMMLNKKFDRRNVGLEHFAFSIKDIKDLKEVEKVLIHNDIKNSGIHLDSASGKEKIWLDDPSNIRLEFYL